MKLIINADDFGINDVVTHEIERVIKSQAISSTTVMANGACLSEVRRIASENPEISYGVHLCLSEYSSLTKSSTLQTVGLIDETGFFIPKAIFKIKNLENDKVKKAIQEELNAQIDVVSSLGFPISHADSHHHVHTLYQLRDVFTEVLQARGVKKIRVGRRFDSPRKILHFDLWIKRNRLNNYYRSSFITADAFFSYADFTKTRNTGGDKIVELMCHPGHPGRIYEEEMKIVKEKIALKNNTIQLISYNDLY